MQEKHKMNAELESLIVEKAPGISPEVRAKIQAFYQLLCEENEVQNLTRLISPTDFYYGHLVDVLELLKSGLISFPAVDLGSGGGVPGLLAALFSDSAWVLVDSEKRKAEFLAKSADVMGLKGHVSTFAGRIEDYLSEQAVNTIVARAVGPVDKIYAWIRSCSTWNTLVLLKGPGWSEEWNRFLNGKFRKELKISREYAYSVGPEEKKRVIIQLFRVPRGTK
jgi:16S rRNA (guanine527-N7)-methyltransferase